MIPMRTLSPIAFAAALAACATTPPTIESHREMLVIDLAARRATTPNWTADIVDCSSETMNCIEAPGRFVMAYRRDCRFDVFDLEAAGHRYLIAGISPHFGLPNAGYRSEKYPTVQLLYGPPAGYNRFVRWDVSWDAPWSSSQRHVILEEYAIRFTGGSSPFRCSPASNPAR